MGEYRDGRWVPTFGDDQFGVVDQPHMEQATINRLNQRIAELEAALLRMHQDNSRLATALQDIANDPIISEPLNMKRGVAQILAIARAAMEGE